MSATVSVRPSAVRYVTKICCDCGAQTRAPAGNWRRCPECRHANQLRMQANWEARTKNGLITRSDGWCWKTGWRDDRFAELDRLIADEQGDEPEADGKALAQSLSERWFEDGANYDWPRWRASVRLWNRWEVMMVRAPTQQMAEDWFGALGACGYLRWIERI